MHAQNKTVVCIKLLVLGFAELSLDKDTAANSLRVHGERGIASMSDPSRKEMVLSPVLCHRLFTAFLQSTASQAPCVS